MQRDYQLYIALPDSYRAGTQRYPVLFVTDANYAFPVVRNIAQRLHKHAGMEEVIVVGLSYANGDTAGFSRRRDYTPSVPKGDFRSDMPGRAPAFGAAPSPGLDDFTAASQPDVASQGSSTATGLACCRSELASRSFDLAAAPTVESWAALAAWLGHLVGQKPP